MAKTNLEQQLRELDRLKARGVITDDEYQSRRAAVLASTEAAIAVKEGGSAAKGIFKWGFFGCFGVIGAIVAFVVVIAIIVAAAGGGDDDDDAGAPGAVGANKGDVHVTLAPGASGEIAPDGNAARRVKVTIVQVTDNVRSSNSVETPGAGMKWWGVEVIVENVGTKEVTAVDWKLRDSQDGEHNQEFVFFAGQPLEGVYDLTPGGKTQGWVFFEIPAGATVKWLRADPNIFLKNDLYFDAE